MQLITVDMATRHGLRSPMPTSKWSLLLLWASSNASNKCSQITSNGFQHYELKLSRLEVSIEIVVIRKVDSEFTSVTDCGT